MKKGILLILLILCLYASIAWALVSFIIYLVKDIPFDFRSLYIAAAIAIVLVVGNIVALFVLKIEAKKEYDKIGTIPRRFKKSAFQSKLDEMVRKRNNLN